MATTEERKKAMERKFVESRPPLAYAKLHGRAGDDSAFDVLITTLPVELGRGPLSTAPGPVICLGEQKAISRKHVRIQWNQDKSCFELVCLGKNGVFVSSQFISKDATVELKSRAALKIGPARVYFLAAIRSTCSTMSGFKMMQKAFERAAAKGKLSPRTGLTVDELVAQIMDMFPKSENELGGLENLKNFITVYIEEDTQNFELIAGTSPPQYKLKPGTGSSAASSAVSGKASTADDGEGAARKKQKTDA